MRIAIYSMELMISSGKRCGGWVNLMELLTMQRSRMRSLQVNCSMLTGVTRRQNETNTNTNKNESKWEDEQANQQYQ